MKLLGCLHKEALPFQNFETLKVKFSLCLINYAQCHENGRGNGGITPPFLISTLDGGE
jgi:hypothetical protein